jgi:hypothetical protein
MPDTQTLEEGMFQWTPGSLSSTTLDRILQDALADIYRDEYRRGSTEGDRLIRTRERISRALRAATGFAY